MEKRNEEGKKFVSKENAREIVDRIKRLIPNKSNIGDIVISAILNNETKVKEVYGGERWTKISDEGGVYQWMRLSDVPSLTITALEDNSSIGYSITGTVDTSGIIYSYDESKWYDWTTGDSITLNNGEFIYVRNLNNTLSSSVSNCLTFTGTGKLSLSGNCMSMINESELSDYCFALLFFNNQAIVSITNDNFLPSTKLAKGCYRRMFHSCANLTSVGDMTLEQNEQLDECFYYMFSGTGLIQTPITNIYNQGLHSCHSMFDGCTALTTFRGVIDISTPLKQDCLRQMFKGCSLLVNPPAEIKFTTVDILSAGGEGHSNLRYMFQNCTSLAIPPIITYTDANYVGVRTFGQMFMGCTSLKVSQDSGDHLFFHSCPAGSSPFTASNLFYQMFNGTGGAFAGTPAASKNYYYND